jgi:hypothetical protein
MDSNIGPYEGIEYTIINDIKIYSGSTTRSREQHIAVAKYLDSIIPPDDVLFSSLTASTLTAQGLMSNISFDEKEIIDMLSEPTGAILMIGCNFAEKFNPKYIPAVPVKKSTRGRRPKVKPVSKRKLNGSGKYFSSQITFLIEHPVSKIHYKIKLFRNGVFQVPGIKDPSMEDLIAPITILRDYLSYNFGEKIEVLNFMAVMRNYKAKLVDENLHVDLEELERYINEIKKAKYLKPFIENELQDMPTSYLSKAMSYIGKTNPWNVAEVTYNTDRCFCLIIKFYRPISTDSKKKTTLKLLKRGKLNFDGANSSHEVEELYQWLRYIYTMKKDDILVNVNNIYNVYDEKEMAKLNPAEFIYDESDDECTTYKTKKKAKQSVDEDDIEIGKLIMNNLNNIDIVDKYNGVNDI